MLTLSRLFLVVLIALTATACSAQTPQLTFQTERRDMGFMFYGGITPSSVDVLREQLRESDELVINSRGGERRSGERIADLLFDRNVGLRVNGECFSACALYLALGAPRSEVPEGALLLFHSDTEMWMRALAARPEKFSERDRVEIERADGALRRVLQRRGISPHLLSCITTAIGPRYGELRRTAPAPAGALSTHDVQLTIPTDYDFVWLSPEVLAHYDVRNVDVQWSPNEGARESYVSHTGRRIVWVDTVEQCQ